MDTTQRFASIILMVAIVGIIFGAIVAVAGLVRDVSQNSLKQESISIIIFTLWIAAAFFIGLDLGQFKLTNAARFLSRWGIWPAVWLSLVNVFPASMQNWPLLQWPGFLIWFVPMAIICLFLGAREMRRADTQKR
jgi:preprotein translocase subunit SecE